MRRIPRPSQNSAAFATALYLRLAVLTIFAGPAIAFCVHTAAAAPLGQSASVVPAAKEQSPLIQKASRGGIRGRGMAFRGGFHGRGMAFRGGGAWRGRGAAVRRGGAVWPGGAALGAIEAAAPFGGVPRATGGQPAGRSPPAPRLVSSPRRPRRLGWARRPLRVTAGIIRIPAAGGVFGTYAGRLSREGEERRESLRGGCQARTFAPRCFAPF